MLWVKISKEDYSITEGEWTLSNAKLMDVGERNAAASYPERVVKCCVRNGYLYVLANNKKGIYKINLSNPADVTLIDFGFTSKWKPLCENGSCEVYMTLIGDLIVGGWLGYFLGGFDGLLYALVVFMTVDYITGVMCAVSDKKLSSAVGFKGICRRVLILLLAGIANLLDVQVIGTGAVLRTAVIFFYLSNEGVSLLENAAYLGLPIPGKLKMVLAQLHERAESDGGNDEIG